MENLNEIMPKKYQVKVNDVIRYESNDYNAALSEYTSTLAESVKVELFEGETRRHAKGTLNHS